MTGEITVIKDNNKLIYTSRHSWFNNKKLVIEENNKRTWFLNDKIISSNEEFNVDDLYWCFAWLSTSYSPGCMVKDCSECNKDETDYGMLETPVPKDLKITFIKSRNGGVFLRSSDKIGYIEGIEYTDGFQTYKDVFNFIGCSASSFKRNNETINGYPDSVYLIMKYENNILYCSYDR